MGSPPEGRSGHTCLSPGGSALPVLHSQLLEKQPPSQVVVVTRKVTLATGGVCRGPEGTFLGNQLQARGYRAGGLGGNLLQVPSLTAGPPPAPRRGTRLLPCTPQEPCLQRGRGRLSKA